MGNLIITLTETPLGSTVVSMGDASFTISGASSVGVDQTGVIYAVPAVSEVTITAISPAQSLDGGSIINGAHKNMTMSSSTNITQGIDQRYVATWNAEENATVPVTLAVRDRLTLGISGTTIATRNGDFVDFAAVHCVDRAPTETEVLGPTIRFAGDSAEPMILSADIDAWYTAFHGGGYTADTTDVPLIPFETLTAGLSGYWPHFAAVRGENGIHGYESFSPSGLSDYGREINLYTMSAAMAITLPDSYYTEAQKKDIARRLLRLGIDIGIPFTKATDFGGLFAAGGHPQWYQFPVVFALGILGRGADLPTFWTKAGANWQQCIKVTSQIVQDCTGPHSDSWLPWFARLRTLPTYQPAATNRVRMTQNMGGPNSPSVDYFGSFLHGPCVIRTADGSKTATLSGSFNTRSNRPAVKGAGQSGTSLIIDGVVFFPEVGDTFTVAGVTGTYTLSATPTIVDRQTTISFTPALDSTPADNAILTFEGGRWIDIELTGANPFTGGESVYFAPGPVDFPQVGMYCWNYAAYSGNMRNLYAPDGNRPYQGQNRYGGGALALKIMDETPGYTFWSSEFNDVIGYCETSFLPAYPSASNDNRDAIGAGFSGINLAAAYWAANIGPRSAIVAPSAFVLADWSLSAGGVVTISSLPDCGGLRITNIEYRLNGGSWVSIGGLGGFVDPVGGGFALPSGFTIASYAGENVELRAVNFAGTSGAASDIKTA